MKRRSLLLGLSFLLAGCGDVGDIDTTQADLVNATPAEVNAASGHLKAPGTAITVNYFYASWQGSEEYINFRDSRASADAYAEQFIGPVAEQSDVFMGIGPDKPWWPRDRIAKARRAQTGPTPNGYLKIVIVDHGTYSEVWASQIFT